MTTDKTPSLPALHRMSECDSPGMCSDEDGEYVYFSDAASAIESLQAEVERLRECNKGLARIGAERLWTIAELTSERDAALKDARRLDWCLDILFYDSPIIKTAYLVTDAGCGCCGEGRGFPAGTLGRDAIDAAIEDKHQGEA